MPEGIGRRRVAIAVGALVVLAVAALSAARIVALLTAPKSRPAVLKVYLSDDARPDDVALLKTYIMADRRVSGVAYVSKSEALRRFQEDAAKRPSLPMQLRGNPLPAFFEVSIPDPRDFDAVGRRIGRWTRLPETVIIERSKSGYLTWRRG